MDNRHLPIMGDLQGDSFNDLYKMDIRYPRAGKVWGIPLELIFGSYLRKSIN